MTDVPPAEPGRPTVGDVAEILVARLKANQDPSTGRAMTEFTETTSPTAAEVDRKITAAYRVITAQLAPVGARELAVLAECVAYDAALRCEAGYFPELLNADDGQLVYLRGERDRLFGRLAAIAPTAGAPWIA